MRLDFFVKLKCRSYNIFITWWTVVASVPLSELLSWDAAPMPLGRWGTLDDATWHQDDGCCLLPHIFWTFRRFFSLQSTSGRFRFLVPPSGTTCLSTSHLRRHSRFSDNDSRHFCFPVPTKTPSYDSCVTITIHHYCLETCGLCKKLHYLGHVKMFLTMILMMMIASRQFCASWTGFQCGSASSLRSPPSFTRFCLGTLSATWQMNCCLVTEARPRKHCARLRPKRFSWVKREPTSATEPSVQLDLESGTVCRRTSDSRACHIAVSDST